MQIVYTIIPMHIHVFGFQVNIKSYYRIAQNLDVMSGDQFVKISPTNLPLSIFPMKATINLSKFFSSNFV